MNNKTKYAARLPMVRVTPDVKERLVRIAAQSVGGLSDHMREAIERYVEQEEARAQVTSPAVNQ